MYKDTQWLDNMIVDRFQSLLRMMPVRNQNASDAELGCNFSTMCRIAHKQRPRRIDFRSLDQYAAGCNF